MFKIGDQTGYRFLSEKHVHTLNGIPLIGVTTSLSVLSKELTWWASGMACGEFGWLNPKYSSAEECSVRAGKVLAKIKGMTLAEYVPFIRKAYSAHHDFKEKAAGKGIDLHAEIERFIKDTMAGTRPSDPYDERIKPFIEWSKKNVKRFLFSEAHCFSESLWVGGIADFGYEGFDGKYYLGDIKSAKEAYFNYWVQAGAYALQFEEHMAGLDGNGKVIFILEKPFDGFCVVPFGAKQFEPVIDMRVAMYKHSFRNTLSLYKNKQVFDGKNGGW